MKFCVLSPFVIITIRAKPPLYPVRWQSVWWYHYLLNLMKGEDKRISYRVQDFVEVHKADGNRDGLEEDRCECNEPQTLERN